MPLKWLTHLEQTAELLGLLGADLSAYHRWQHLRWDDVQRNLRRYDAEPEIGKFMAEYASGLVAQLTELMENGHFDTAAELIPDLVETLCCQAQGRYVRAGATPSQRTDKAAVPECAAIPSDFAAAA